MSVSTKLAELEDAARALTAEERLLLARKLIDMSLEGQATRKPTNLSEFYGTVDFGIDGLEYQQKIREEWDRDL